MSGLRRAGRVEGKTLSALRPAHGKVAWFFLPCVLGCAVADCGSLDRLYFLRWISDAEPDALKSVVAGVEDFSSCLRSAAAYDVYHVRRRLLRAQSTCMSHHHTGHRAPAGRGWFGDGWLAWQTNNTEHYVELILWSFADRRSAQLSAAAAQTTV